jgi:hypothetical protein
MMARRSVNPPDILLASCDPAPSSGPSAFELGSVCNVIFVKTNADSLEAKRHEPVEAIDERIVVMSEGKPAGLRPGWNPNEPWTAEQAHERAHRYWPFDGDRVRAWLEHPETCPDLLVALVPDSGRSVVRYVWPIDKSGVWHKYPSVDGRWGIPVLRPNEPLADHPLLGKVPRTDDGFGILRNHSSGVRAGAFTVIASPSPERVSSPRPTSKRDVR